MHVLTRLFAAGLCAAAAASAVHAQTRLGSAPQSGTRPAATPSSSAQAARAAPQPAGLQPIFPAGISSGSGAAVSSDPVARTTSPIPAGTSAPVNPGTGSPGRGTGSTGSTGSVATPATNVLGAAGATVRGPAQDLAGAGGFSAHDEARSFFFADANKDGELTRAEVARLSIATLPFEEMDRNFDGVITRFEYEDSLR